MNLDIVTGHFERIGTALRTTVHSGSWATPRGSLRSRILQPAETRYVLNVINHGRSGELFTLDIWPSPVDRLEFVTVDVRPAWQHLLLLVRRIDVGGIEVRKDKFLCGHDERHWFITSLPEKRGLANVTDAFEALKPEIAIASQLRHGVRPKNRQRRRNAGFIRQGEWFFIPEPGFQPPDRDLVLRNEPLQRPFGTPHLVEELCRIGGETVYVHRRYPAGLTEAKYRELLQQRPAAKGWAWRLMRRNPEVFARGKVRHPDHKRIVLAYWHRVVMADERGTTAGGRPATVAFLD